MFDSATTRDCYRDAFGAGEQFRPPMGEKMGRAELCIGDTILMPSDEWADTNAVSPNNRSDVRASFMI